MITTDASRECDKEPIHLIGGVQGHGCMVLFTVPEFTIESASRNAPDFLQTGRNGILGLKLEHLIPEELFAAVKSAVAEFPWPNTFGRHLPSHWDAYLFHSDGLFGLELEKKPAEAGFDSQVLLKEYVLQSKSLNSLGELAKLTCQAIREVSGMDRVMMYKFLPPEMHGEVVGEDRVSDAHSYMSHRFPASDIPKPARMLYLRNQVRLIPDVNAEVSPIEPAYNPLTKKPIDLSDSRLRSVAKIHLEYLRNMKVAASFSVSVTANDELWGLIACHHSRPHRISQSRRTACELIAHTFAARVIHLEEARAMDRRLTFERGLRALLEDVGRAEDLERELIRNHRKIDDLFQSSGVALVRHQTCDFAGATPPQADTLKIRDLLWEKMQSEKRKVVALPSLQQLDQSFAYFSQLASGVLGVAIDESDRSMLLVFRPEMVRHITWGGDPRKQLEKRGFAGSVNPRQSFEAWNETVHGHSREWDRHEADGILFLKEFFFGLLVKRNKMLQELSRKFVGGRNGGPESVS